MTDYTNKMEEESNLKVNALGIGLSCFSSSWPFCSSVFSLLAPVCSPASLAGISKPNQAPQNSAAICPLSFHCWGCPAWSLWYWDADPCSLPSTPHNSPCPSLLLLWGRSSHTEQLLQNRVSQGTSLSFTGSF